MPETVYGVSYEWDRGDAGGHMWAGWYASQYDAVMAALKEWRELTPDYADWWRVDVYAVDASERDALEDDWPDWDGDVLHMDGPESA